MYVLIFIKHKIRISKNVIRNCRSLKGGSGGKAGAKGSLQKYIFIWEKIYKKIQN